MSKIGAEGIYGTPAYRYRHHDVRGRRSELNPRLCMAIIAREVKVTRSYISKIFRGERNPSLEVAVRIARSMGMTVEELYRFIQDRKREQKQA